MSTEELVEWIAGSATRREANKRFSQALSKTGARNGSEEWQQLYSAIFKVPSQRKPHNDWAGYICELKSKHPKLPGHFVVVDSNHPDSDLDNSGGRWYVCYEPLPGSGKQAALLVVEKRNRAREVMKDMAAGIDAADFGQEDE